MKALDIYPRHQNPIVLIGGSRVWNETETVYRHLTQCDPLMVLTIQNRGAVSIVADWCEETGVPHVMMPPPRKANPLSANEITNLRLVNLAGHLADINDAPLLAYLYLWGKSPTTRHLQQVLIQHGIPTIFTEKPVATPKTQHIHIN